MVYVGNDTYKTTRLFNVSKILQTGNNFSKVNSVYQIDVSVYYFTWEHKNISGFPPTKSDHL